MKKALLAMICTGMMVFSPAVTTVFAAEEAAAVQEDGQNPVMNYVGKYGAGRANILVEADGTEGAKVSISWSSSAFEHSEWTMSGSFDEETHSISYDNCVMKTITYEDESDQGTEVINYENGTGTITFHEDGDLTLTWDDNQDHIADDTEFLFSPMYADSESMSELPGEVADAVNDESSIGVTSSTSLDDGIFTVSLERIGADRDGFYWELNTGDKGDASLFELLTQTDMEEGFAYVGSFRGLEGADGEDTIRLVHTNGYYVDEYLDYDITVEDGQIVGNSGGSHTLPTAVADMAPVLGGVWQEENDPNLCMELTPSEDNGFNVTVSDGSGRDGQASFYTMTMYYDCLKEAFIYRNGTTVTAEIIDGTEEALTESAAQEGQDLGDSGYVYIDQTSDDICLVWDKTTSDGTETFRFVSAQE